MRKEKMKLWDEEAMKYHQEVTDQFGMKCQACNGKIGMLIDENYHRNPFDTLGVCQKCTGVLLKDNTKVIAVDFCQCQEIKPEQQIFYFRPNGRHGWLHTICGQITQTG